MSLPLDELLNLLLPWDFTVEFQGTAYETRRPSVGELEVLTNLVGIDSPSLSKFCSSLFLDSPPDFQQFAVHQRNWFLSGYLAYFSKRLFQPEKKRRGNHRQTVKRGSPVKLATSLVMAGIAVNWSDAIAMPADFAIHMLQEKQALSESGRDADDNGVRTEKLPGGGVKHYYTDIRQLGEALKAARWGGVKVG